MQFKNGQSMCGMSHLKQEIYKWERKTLIMQTVIYFSTSRLYWFAKLYHVVRLEAVQGSFQMQKWRNFRSSKIFKILLKMMINQKRIGTWNITKSTCLQCRLYIAKECHYSWHAGIGSRTIWGKTWSNFKGITYSICDTTWRTNKNKILGYALMILTVNSLSV